MDIFEVAEQGAGLRESLINVLQQRVGEAQFELAQAMTGCAVALLRELAPEAREAWFRVEDGGHGGKYAVVYRIDGRAADEVLFDIDATNDSNVDYDGLTPAEDFLAGAAEACEAALTSLVRDGEFVLTLVR